MRILLDTNVIIDALLQREPWGVQASRLWTAMAEGAIKCFITASSLTDIAYISSIHGRRHGIVDFDVRQIVGNCLDVLNVIAVDRETLEAAYRRSGIDFEDDLQIECAFRVELDYIISRDSHGFAACIIPVTSTEQFMKHLDQQSTNETTPIQLPLITPQSPPRVKRPNRSRWDSPSDLPKDQS